MSPVYGRSREQKLTDNYSQGSLSTLEHIRNLNPDEGSYAAGTMLVPDIFLKDIRSLNKTNDSLCFYIGCKECRKQMDSTDSVTWTCSTHGRSESQKIYGVQLTLQDPEHKTEVTMWEECLKSCICKLQPGDKNIDAEDTMEQLNIYLRGKLLCAS